MKRGQKTAIRSPDRLDSPQPMKEMMMFWSLKCQVHHLHWILASIATKSSTKVTLRIIRRTTLRTLRVSIKAPRATRRHRARSRRGQIGLKNTMTEIMINVMDIDTTTDMSGQKWWMIREQIKIIMKVNIRIIEKIMTKVKEMDQEMARAFQAVSLPIGQIGLMRINGLAEVSNFVNRIETMSTLNVRSHE